ncbi:hypothetical protein HDU98_006365 [Podochytrium sp. JEL0797]|nr:hypothetical protein HDU98_006365 [Podochytrium sp. JEL0797]
MATAASLLTVSDVVSLTERMSRCAISHDTLKYRLGYPNGIEHFTLEQLKVIMHWLHNLFRMRSDLRMPQYHLSSGMRKCFVVNYVQRQLYGDDFETNSAVAAAALNVLAMPPLLATFSNASLSVALIPLQEPLANPPLLATFSNASLSVALAMPSFLSTLMKNAPLASLSVALLPLQDNLTMVPPMPTLPPSVSQPPLPDVLAMPPVFSILSKPSLSVTQIHLQEPLAMPLFLSTLMKNAPLASLSALLIPVQERPPILATFSKAPRSLAVIILLELLAIPPSLAAALTPPQKTLAMAIF